MSEMHKKLERWAEKLLDTGKRNNLINFHDAKSSSAEIVSPTPEDVFGRCAVGNVFQAFDPKLEADEDDDLASEENKGAQKSRP